uniref:ubiquitinyl hydrolase 1 n=1 Tax=Neolamprologus brichardi TaxID=32507 RepID=A0A3Q4GYQ1_NEOBR
MDSIFHEKQEGSLCAQHCLNNLLQGEYFTPVDLSSIAHQLDEEERMRMAEGGMASEEYRTFLQVIRDRFFILFSFQWFNLNSLLTGPELISDTYLALFLAQLQQEGYSIFVIRGNLPECEAEQILGIMRCVEQNVIMWKKETCTSPEKKILLKTFTSTNICGLFILYIIDLDT